LDRRAEQFQKSLAGQPVELRIRPSRAQWGGGTLPQASIESIRLELKPRDLTAAAFAEKLRRGQPPVIAGLTAGWLTLDLRTVLPDEDAALLQAIRSNLQPAP
jgi:L-seryl-tRNA(Ser) seleniumtransferase